MILRFSGAGELEFKLSLTLVHNLEIFTFPAALEKHIPPKEKAYQLCLLPLTAPPTPTTILNPCMVKNLFSCKTDLIRLNIQGLCQGINYLIIWSQL